MRIPDTYAPDEPQSMAAMTDVVFLLLIFFIATMTGYVETTLLECNLPTAAVASAAVNLERVVRVELTADGGRLVNGIPHLNSDFAALARRYGRLMPDAEFLIQCHPESPHHQLVSLLAELSRHNLKNLKLLRAPS